MHNLGRGLAAALALVLWLGVPGASKAAGGFEDAWADCSYPKTFDLMIMRPVGLGAIAIGTALFVPYAPIALLTSPSDLDEPWNTFVVRPTTFTFGRPLGRCTTDAQRL
jgi:hypothetical protein